MLCEKELRQEYIRLPKLYRESLKTDDLETALDIKLIKEILDWILNEKCECE